MLEIESIQQQIISWEKGEVQDVDLALCFFTNYHQIKYPNKKLKSLIEESKYREAIDALNFKCVKGKAMIALKQWRDGHWPFQLIRHIPSPYEVLKSQAQGIRPISLIFQKDLKPILAKEDCFEFFVHDLEHGYMYFHDQVLARGQQSFFQKIESSLQGNLWHKYLQNRDFEEKFHYLISDMNTHIEHYRHYLKSMIPPDEFSHFEFLFS